MKGFVHLLGSFYLGMGLCQRLGVITRSAPGRAALCAVALCLVSCSTTIVERRPVSFAHYDEPLYEQVTDRIKAKVMARVGTQWNDRDRYFIIPFAYQNAGHDPELSHSFISVIRVFADGKQPKRTAGLKERTYAGRQFEAFTISWMPADYAENPNLCVFEGFGALFIPVMNECPISRGKSFDLPTTLKFAVDKKVAVGMWGPYEIVEKGFELGVKRMELLNDGTIGYRADDRLYRFRKHGRAINCFHAMASLQIPFPDGGLFNTGLETWGLNGTRRVLREYTQAPGNKGTLLEPVDLEADLFGFVYAEGKSADDVYDPFINASAYHR